MVGYDYNDASSCIKDDDGNFVCTIASMIKVRKVDKIFRHLSSIPVHRRNKIFQQH